MNGDNITAGLSDKMAEGYGMLRRRDDWDMAFAPERNGEDGQLYGLDGGEQNGDAGGTGTKGTVDEIT